MKQLLKPKITDFLDFVLIDIDKLITHQTIVRHSFTQSSKVHIKTDCRIPPVLSIIDTLNKELFS